MDIELATLRLSCLNVLSCAVSSIASSKNQLQSKLVKNQNDIRALPHQNRAYVKSYRKKTIIHLTPNFDHIFMIYVLSFAKKQF